MSQSTESMSLLWHVIDQWKAWVLVAIAAPLAVVVWNQTGGSFHAWWLVAFTVGMAMVALRNTARGVRWKNRLGL